MTTHTCPRPGCPRQVPDHLFACRDDWFALPRTARDLIWKTAHLPVLNPERRTAFRAAEDAWKAADAP